MLLIIR